METGKQLMKKKKTAHTMLKHLKKYCIKHHFLKSGTADCEQGWQNMAVVEEPVNESTVAFQLG